MPSFTASTEVDSPSISTKSGMNSSARTGVLEWLKGGEFNMTYSDWFTYFRARFASEEGQTMAEYGVVLAVICVLTVGAFTLLSGGIRGAIDNVLPFLG